MATFGHYSTQVLLHKKGLNSVYSAVSAARPGKEFAVKVFQLPSFLEEETRNQAEAFLDSAKVQQRIASTGARYWAPVYEQGSASEGAYYATDKYACSAQELIDGHVRLSAAALHNIVTSVVNGLLELKKALGRPHGNLKPSNILISQHSDLPNADVVLCDPVAGRHLDPEVHWAADVRDVAELIYQLVTHSSSPMLDNQQIPPSEQWRALGKNADDWRSFCSQLMSAALRPGEISLERLASQLPQLKPTEGFLPRKWVIIGALPASLIVAILLFWLVILPYWRQKIVNDNKTWIGPLAKTIYGIDKAAKAKKNLWDEHPYFKNPQGEGFMKNLKQVHELLNNKNRTTVETRDLAENIQDIRAFFGANWYSRNSSIWPVLRNIDEWTREFAQEPYNLASLCAELGKPVRKLKEVGPASERADVIVAVDFILDAVYPQERVNKQEKDYLTEISAWYTKLEPTGVWKPTELDGPKPSNVIDKCETALRRVNFEAWIDKLKNGKLGIQSKSSEIRDKMWPFYQCWKGSTWVSGKDHIAYQNTVDQVKNVLAAFDKKVSSIDPNFTEDEHWHSVLEGLYKDACISFIQKVTDVNLAEFPDSVDEWEKQLQTLPQDSPLVDQLMHLETFDGEKVKEEINDFNDWAKNLPTIADDFNNVETWFNACYLLDDTPPDSNRPVRTVFNNGIDMLNKFVSDANSQLEGETIIGRVNRLKGIGDLSREELVTVADPNSKHPEAMYAAWLRLRKMQPAWPADETERAIDECIRSRLEDIIKDINDLYPDQAKEIRESLATDRYEQIRNNMAFYRTAITNETLNHFISSRLESLIPEKGSPETNDVNKIKDANDIAKAVYIFATTDTTWLSAGYDKSELAKDPNFAENKLAEPNMWKTVVEGYRVIPEPNEMQRFQTEFRETAILIENTHNSSDTEELEKLGDRFLQIEKRGPRIRKHEVSIKDAYASLLTELRSLRGRVPETPEGNPLLDLDAEKKVIFRANVKMNNFWPVDRVILNQTQKKFVRPTKTNYTPDWPDYIQSTKDDTVVLQLIKRPAGPGTEGFYMAVHEISNAQYGKKDGKPDDPVTGITYEDAKKWAKDHEANLPLISEYSDAIKSPDNNQDYHLRGEAWKQAVMNYQAWTGTKIGSGSRPEVPYTSAFENNGKPPDPKTAPITSHPRENDWQPRSVGSAIDRGLRDLIGNVWEWTEDWDPDKKKPKIWGASCLSDPNEYRGLPQGIRGGKDIGFRVVVRIRNP